MAATNYTTQISPPPAVGIASFFSVTFDDVVPADVVFAVSDPGGINGSLETYSGGSFPDGSTLTVPSGSKTASLKWIPARSGPIRLTYRITSGTRYPDIVPVSTVVPVVGGGGLASPVYRQ